MASRTHTHTHTHTHQPTHTTFQQDQWPGQAMAIKIKETLFEGSSAYQQVKIFDTETYGKMMTLDGDLTHDSFLIRFMR
jgi:spermidine synthase